MNFKSLEFQICIREHHSHFLFENKKLLTDFIFVKNPKLYWLADPFVIKYGNAHYLFAEAASRITGKGKLVYTAINENNLNKCKWKIFKREKFHLSFPNVFIKDKKIMMLPETYQDKCVAIYSTKLLKNDIAWTKEKVLLDNIQCVDSVFLGDFIITYNISVEPFSLQLYSSGGILLDSLKDANSCLRPGGKIFNDANSKILPTQLCKNLYGEGLFFNSITILNNKISLKQLSHISYDDLNNEFGVSHFVGIHTYNFDDRYEVIDIRKKKFNFFGLVGKFYDKFKKRIKFLSNG